METQREALGPAVRTGDDYRPIWGYIPHFIHTPFYVYAYAFGDCLVNALWQNFTAERMPGMPVPSWQNIAICSAQAGPSAMMWRWRASGSMRVTRHSGQWGWT